MYNQITSWLNQQQTTIAVVANGQFPIKPELIHCLQSADIIIACDGAIKNLAKNNIIADFVIGDGDSSDIEQYQNFIKHGFIHIQDQECNDLSKAINFIQEKFPAQTNVLIFAANGYREDHALANIALLIQYSQLFPAIAMISDYGIFNVCLPESSIFETVVGQQISFFSLETNTKISCPQLKWQLENQTLAYLNSGTLNQATDCQLTISTNKPILLYRAFEIK